VELAHLDRATHALDIVLQPRGEARFVEAMVGANLAHVARNRALIGHCLPYGIGA
jgi:hypothetical protein